jgi:hypothetical protein
MSSLERREMSDMEGKRVKVGWGNWDGDTSRRGCRGGEGGGGGGGGGEGEESPGIITFEQ